jgi:hypothetical protein
VTDYPSFSVPMTTIMRPSRDRDFDIVIFVVVVAAVQAWPVKQRSPGVFVAASASPQQPRAPSAARGGRS